MNAANDEPRSLDPDMMLRMAEFITHAMALALNGEPLPFTLLVWDPKGAKHVSTVTHEQLVVPLRRLATMFEQEEAGEKPQVPAETAFPPARV